ncbi:MAG: transglutaminase family protein [Leptonema sp. (in: bacteria)]
MGTTKEISEIQNLFYLYFEHKETQIREKIKQKILEKIPFGYHPFYFIETIEHPEIRFFLRKEFEELNLNKILFDFQFFYRESSNLMMGSYLVSCFSDSIFLTYEEYQRKFFVLVKEFLKLYPDFDSYSNYEKFQKITNFLFFIKDFKGNTRDYYNPENSFLSVVLDSKKGNPITLSVLVLLFYEVLKKILESKSNKKIDFKIVGINLPGHFIASYRSKEYTTLFDPFNYGNPLTYEDCCKFLLANGFLIDINYFYPAETKIIIRRMLKNLLNFYSNSKNLKKEKTLETLIRNLDNLIQVEEKKIEH